MSSEVRIDPRKAHAKLCAIAVKWLKRPNSAGGPGCLVAVSEVAGGWTGEVPDAIGFSEVSGVFGSTVIEVKVSRSDFLSDKNKPHRQADAAMGVWRYYMAPEGMIRLDELPAGWGLIEVNPRGHCKVLAGAMRDARQIGYGALSDQVKAWRLVPAVNRETWLLVRLLSRLGDPEKLNRERRDQYANNAILSKSAQEKDELLRALRKDSRSMARELDLYRSRFGALPKLLSGEVSATPRERFPLFNAFNELRTDAVASSHGDGEHYALLD